MAEGTAEENRDGMTISALLTVIHDALGTICVTQCGHCLIKVIDSGALRRRRRKNKQMAK
jgi:hypothetical protein